MGQLAYKTADHETSMVKGSLPDDYITEYINPDLLVSLDGWQVDDEDTVMQLVAQNKDKLDAFLKAQQDAQIKQQLIQQPKPQPTLQDLMSQLNNLQSLITARLNQDGYT